MVAVAVDETGAPLAEALPELAADEAAVALDALWREAKRLYLAASDPRWAPMRQARGRLALDAIGDGLRKLRAVVTEGT